MLDWLSNLMLLRCIVITISRNPILHRSWLIENLGIRGHNTSGQHKSKWVPPNLYKVCTFLFSAIKLHAFSFYVFNFLPTCLKYLLFLGWVPNNRKEVRIMAFLFGGFTCFNSWSSCSMEMERWIYSIPVFPSQWKCWLETHTEIQYI